MRIEPVEEEGEAVVLAVGSDHGQEPGLPRVHGFHRFLRDDLLAPVRSAVQVHLVEGGEVIERRGQPAPRQDEPALPAGQRGAGEDAPRPIGTYRVWLMPSGWSRSRATISSNGWPQAASATCAATLKPRVA